MEIRTQHIAEHPEHIPTLAKWFQDEWGYQNPELSVEARIRELQQKHSKSDLPMTFIVLRDGQLMGTYSFDMDDMTTHRHLSPWLASVYVAEPLRGQAIGTALMEDAVARAKDLKIQTLFLFTGKLEKWYESFGWRTVETVMYCGELVTIMKLEL